MMVWALVVAAVMVVVGGGGGGWLWRRLVGWRFWVVVDGCGSGWWGGDVRWRRLAGWRCWVAVLVVAAVGGLAMLGGGDC